jgi:hypothetical protein
MIGDPISGMDGQSVNCEERHYHIRIPIIKERSIVNSGAGIGSSHEHPCFRQSAAGTGRFPDFAKAIRLGRWLEASLACASGSDMEEDPWPDTPLPSVAGAFCQKREGT